MARPKSKSPLKTKTLGFSVTEDQYKEAVNHAKNQNTLVSKYVSDRYFKTKITIKKLSENEEKLLYQLMRLGKNIQEINKNINFENKTGDISKTKKIRKNQYQKALTDLSLIRKFIIND